VWSPDYSHQHAQQIGFKKLQWLFKVLNQKHIETKKYDDEHSTRTIESIRSRLV